MPGDEADPGAVGQEAAGDDERGRQRRAGLETQGRRDGGAHRGPAAQDQGVGAPGMSHSVINSPKRYTRTYFSSCNFISGDQPKGKTDGGEAAVTRPTRSQPAAAAAATAATAKEIKEQRRGSELPLAAAGRNGDDDEPEVAGAAIAAAEPHDAIALTAG